MKPVLRYRPLVRRVPLLIMAALLMLVACAPAPLPDPPAPPATSTTPDPPGIALPPRPQELPLDDVDPCAILDERQRADLGLNGGMLARTSTAAVFAGPACTLHGFEPRAISVGLGLVLGNGIETITEPGALTDEITAIDVAGFPAILARPELPDFCAVDVDVADGQFLNVLFGDGGRLPPIPQDQLCRDVVVVAEQAVLSLLGT